jgi:hypothetical protein
MPLVQVQLLLQVWIMGLVLLLRKLLLTMMMLLLLLQLQVVVQVVMTLLLGRMTQQLPLMMAQLMMRLAWMTTLLPLAGRGRRRPGARQP